MGIILYKNSAEQNRVDKSSYLQQALVISNYELLDESNTINPSFRIEGNVDILKCNYCYWEESGRYYYINITTLSYGIYMVQGEVDVLHTYRSIIKNALAVCTRGNVQNPWVPDDGIVVQNNRAYEYIVFPGQLQKNLKNILIVAGGVE